jgi:hypothetical protein
MESTWAERGRSAETLENGIEKVEGCMLWEGASALSRSVGREVRRVLAAAVSGRMYSRGWLDACSLPSHHG